MQTVIQSLSHPKEYQSTLKTHQLRSTMGRADGLTAEECIAAHMAPLKIKEERLMQRKRTGVQGEPDRVRIGSRAEHCGQIQKATSPSLPNNNHPLRQCALNAAPAAERF
jgi:hypothetical protein